MLQRLRERIGSAHLIGLAALILALTGTSVALPGSGSVDSGDIRNKAVKSVDIGTAQVRTVDIRDNAVSGRDVAEGTLGPVRFARRAGNVLWAVVRNPAGAANAVLVRSSQPAPTVLEGTGVTVAFSQNVAGCAWSATRGSSEAFGVEGAGWAQTAGVAGNLNAIDVRTRRGSVPGGGNAGDIGEVVDGDFHLVVVCPA